MTGFGAAEGAVAGGWIRFEIRTVNHRHFNLATKLPAELAVLEGELRERLRREFDRGHVAVQARWTEYPAAAGGFTVDVERARVVTERLRELFAQAGAVESAAVVTDRDTGNSRGFGFVEMASAEAAAEAVKLLNGKEVDGRTLKVELANSAGAGGGRSGGGGGYRSRGVSGGSGSSGGRW